MLAVCGVRPKVTQGVRKPSFTGLCRRPIALAGAEAAPLLRLGRKSPLIAKSAVLHGDLGLPPHHTHPFGLRNSLRGATATSIVLPQTSVSPRGPGIAAPTRLAVTFAEMIADADVNVAASVLEPNPTSANAEDLILKPLMMPPVVGCRTVVTEDFRFFNTSTIAVLQAAPDRRMAGHSGGDEKRLSKSSRSCREQLVAVLGHDLRNPLAFISSATRRLSRDR
jgi:hypothetical protein